MTEQTTGKRKNGYDSTYKILLFIPIIIFIASIFYLISFYKTNNDFFLKDTSLSGGTSITIKGEFNSKDIESLLQKKFPDASARDITEIRTNKPIASIFESSAQPEELKAELENILEYNLTEENSNIEFTGPALSSNFYKQLIAAIIVSFILMAIVIFFLFKTFVPSAAILFAVISDIIMSIALVDILEIRISAAGIAAFLMLIGYCVDTNILLTTRVLKNREGSVNQRIYGAFKTGIFMTLTALIAVLPAFFVVTGLPDSFRQIFLILALGLGSDIINTWLTNTGIIKWYAHRKGMQ